ncbi:uncharacterized protein BDFB_003719 [Asbolus verrucosus]|uniref:Generative cell specific-1/HAP2 domain-containing protein n=1 Tax=Asbolus verrucosus TaxID=1661398 RepID=A0A482W8J3_ASBVE|nr:uncharacterized protein BDFB_003719 [Asbolus verrucosus]
MQFANIILILISSEFYSTTAVYRVSDNLRKKLDAEEENAICCLNHLGCCKREEKSTVFEVKAILTDCPNLQCTNISKTHKVVVQQNKPILEKLTNCHQKLLLTLNVINEGIPSEKSQYIIIDHIVDAVTLKKVRILNPYAVRVRQDPMLQIYDLNFERAVNSEARERVFNKQNMDYVGCDTSSENPTCGVVQHRGKRVPYSTGFCCSCDAEKNRLMEQQGDAVHWPLPEYHKNDPGGNDYEHYKHYGFTGEDGKMVYGRSQKRADESVNYQQFTELKDGKIRQRRGGQSCDDVDFDALPESFHESTHCLKFANLWYSVYELRQPRIVHKMRIQIFQKYEDCHGNTHWMDLTQGKVLELGTDRRSLVDKDIIARYGAEEVDLSDQALDYKGIKLLVPERRTVDPEQFMILPKKLISPDGKTCDTAGVGYEAFYKQKKRCSLPKGSCLHNQPRHLRELDLKAEQEGRRGNYFLKFFGTLADDPVGYNSTGQLQYLKMMYTKRHASNLYFELNADLVTLLKPNSFATVTEVYTDATNPDRTRIVVKVTNSGLLYGVFYVRLSGCPLGVPASFNNIGSKSVLILSQQQHIFNLYIEYPLPIKEFYCSIHVHNINQELVAVRQIRIQTHDRCICIWHCECACYITDRGLKCTPMSLDSYHEAGFQGGLPFPTQLVESSYLDEMLAMFFSMFIFLILTLLAMGLVKALLGLCCLEIGLWGLDTILGTENKSKIICDNKECEYRDDDGISLAAQFCLNIIFFFLYPLALINIAIKKFCFSAYTLEDEASYEQRYVDYEECECEENEDSKKTTTTNDRSSFSMKYTSSDEKSTETRGSKGSTT